jgi:hypothetical protein
MKMAHSVEWWECEDQCSISQSEQSHLAHTFLPEQHACEWRPEGAGYPRTLANHKTVSIGRGERQDPVERSQGKLNLCSPQC